MFLLIERVENFPSHKSGEGNFNFSSCNGAIVITNSIINAKLLVISKMQNVLSLTVIYDGKFVIGRNTNPSPINN